jgi:hypothetical protein
MLWAALRSRDCSVTFAATLIDPGPDSAKSTKATLFLSRQASGSNTLPGDIFSLAAASTGQYSLIPMKSER